MDKYIIFLLNAFVVGVMVLCYFIFTKVSVDAILGFLVGYFVTCIACRIQHGVWVGS
jgi:hypothetical protein